MASRQRGFTLIEAMVAVVIVSILAAIAIPSFQRFTYRARLAELPTNVQALKNIMQAFYASGGFYITLPPVPTACPGGGLVGRASRCEWGPVFDFDGNDSDRGGYSLIGFRPEGPLWGEYAVVSGCPALLGDQCLTVESRVDLDADGRYALYKFAVPDRNDDFATAVNFGGSVPPSDVNLNPQVGEVAKDILGDDF